jgi:hypothetical protein
MAQFGEGPITLTPDLQRVQAWVADQIRSLRDELALMYRGERLKRPCTLRTSEQNLQPDTEWFTHALRQYRTRL